MSDVRYYEETRCEHGYMESHFTCDLLPVHQYNAFEHSAEECECLGGLRREIIVDDEAAFRVMSGDVIDQLTEDEIREGRKLVAEAVAAALGRGDTRKDDR